jgi:hypothetical protein
VPLLLKPHVTEVLVCDSRKNALSKVGNKNNREDARKLSELLFLNKLHPVYHGETGIRTLKELARSYLALTRLSGGGKPRSQEAASVVVCQAQTRVAGGQTVSGDIPARSAGPRLPYQADEQFPVGDIVNLSPRAGCLKQARPVR